MNEMKISTNVNDEHEPILRVTKPKSILVIDYVCSQTFVYCYHENMLFECHIILFSKTFIKKPTSVQQIFLEISVI